MPHRTFADRVATPQWPEFTEKVKAYTALVNRLEKDLPPLGERHAELWFPGYVRSRLKNWAAPPTGRAGRGAYAF